VLLFIHFIYERQLFYCEAATSLNYLRP
jgi:hypothetical protein